MTRKQNAALDAANIENGGGQIRLEGFGDLPEVDSTISTADSQGAIADLLLHGEVNAIPLKALETTTGLDSRLIRRMIQAERQAGACICANNRDGYYLAESEAERARCVASMRRRALEVYRTADAIERAEVAL